MFLLQSIPRIVEKVRHSALILTMFVLALFGSTDLQSQISFGPGGQTASYTDTRVRGYYFTAPTNFTICQVYVPNSMNNNMWHVEIVKFNNNQPPPAFAATTNAFVSMFYADSVTGNNPISCNVPVSTGEVIGIYGSRSNTNANATVMANSYDGTQPTTNILGNNVTLYRSGMQFPLNNQQMHDIWAEVNGNTGRIIGFHSCCPTPPKPQGPFNMPSNICAGDTVVFWIPKDSIAEDYSWTVPAGDSILSIQGDTMITVAINPFSTGGQICVELEDTCIWSGDTCFNYTIDQPPSPSVITGPTSVCEGDSAWYTISSGSGIIEYQWTLSNATILDSVDTAILVLFNNGTMEACVRVRDSCAWSDTTCLTIQGAVAPAPAEAGPNRTVCVGNVTTLAAVPATVGDGVWSQVSGPILGTFSDSTSASSTFTSSAPGAYVLRWTVTSLGCPITYDQMTVIVNPTPTANFTADDVCEGSPVGFTDLSSANGGTLNSWSWDMTGNGVPNHITQNPIHSFNAPGVYNVRLIVGNQGCTDTITKTINVNPLPDVSIAGENVCLEVPTNFQNNSSVSMGTMTKTYWDFGDGSPIDSAGSGYAPSYTYASPGTYTVTCEVKTNAGCMASDQVAVTVYHLPKATFSVNNSCQFQTTKYFDQSTVTGAQIISWAWTIENGGDTITTQNIENDYEVNGYVPVTLDVWSSFGCHDDTSTYVEIYPTPETEFNFENKVCIGDTLHLESVSSIAYGSIPQYHWVVADSINYFTKEASHLFDKVGTYSVKLTTTSDRGCSSDISKEVPVFEVPAANFEFESVCAESPLQFWDATSFDVEAVQHYQWNFADGSLPSTDANPSHTFATHGTYPVQLYVESFHGCNDVITKDVTIFEKLYPDFNVAPDSGCSPLTVFFSDITQSESGVTWARTWMFGDGSIDKESDVYTYQNYSGKHKEYDVTLKVLTDQGCYSEITKDSFVYIVPQPKADFMTTPEDLHSLTTKNPFVQFENMSIQANRYRWDFGDGEISNEHNPAHEWKEAGPYVVTLVARNIYQCADTITKELTVNHVNVPYIPSAFTPNGDGKNEVFEIQGLEQIAEMRLTIYDRWGNVIHEENSLNASWDGKNRNKQVQNGVYGYRLVYVTIFGEKVEVNGVVTLMGVDQ